MINHPPCLTHRKQGQTWTLTVSPFILKQEGNVSAPDMPVRSSRSRIRFPRKPSPALYESNNSRMKKVSPNKPVSQKMGEDAQSAGEGGIKNPRMKRSGDPGYWKIQIPRSTKAVRNLRAAGYILPAVLSAVRTVFCWNLSPKFAGFSRSILFR
jgi:hypothetical protein